MNDKVKELMAKLKSDLTRLYGERLKGLYLFGSHARNEADEESDVDIMIVLDRVDNYSTEIDRTGEVISELSLRFGMTISRVFAAERQWLQDQTMFFLNIREEALSV
jgi:predicted nucleotidyltransferase